MKEINIAGIPTQIDERKISIFDIQLDTNNPRIGFYKDAQIKDNLDQDEIIFALKEKNPEAYNKLKESIEACRGVLYPIWIIKSDNNRYIVIEGNTRLLIYRDLHEKYLNDDTYKTIPCWILPPKTMDSQMDFIRLEAHLRGTTDWDTYEKARYLYKLNEEEGQSTHRLERHTKMSKNEIENSIKAFKDMEQQYLPQFGNDPSEVFKFSYFVEYEKNNNLKELMKKNNLGISDFCDWVGNKKINRAQDVRDLPELIEDEEVRETFIQKGYDLAMEKLSIKKPDKTSRLFQNIERVIEGLKNLTNWDIIEMKEGEQPGKVALITKLYSVTESTRELIGVSKELKDK